MGQDFGWQRPAREYLALYEELAAGVRGRAPESLGRTGVIAHRSMVSVSPMPVARQGNKPTGTHGRPRVRYQQEEAMNKDLDSQIRERAHQIWERENRPHGKHHEHWLQAKAEIEAERASRKTKRAPKKPRGESKPASKRSRSKPIARVGRHG